MVGIQELGLDIEALIKTPATDTLYLSEQERKILELWDQEEELHLEINLLRAQRDAVSHDDIAALSDEEVQTQVEQAERDLLTARSKHTIRQNIINQVLITDPILKSIHTDPSSPLIARLPPLIHERDVVSMVHTTLAKDLQATHLSVAKLERENIDAMAENKVLAKKMMELAKDVKMEKVEEVRDARVREKLERLEEDVRSARREWRVWKSVVGGIVAGSGVDWASDPRLLEVVMDDEDEMA